MVRDLLQYNLPNHWVFGGGEQCCGGGSIIPDFWQVDVVLKHEGLAPQTSHRAWPPGGLCIKREASLVQLMGSRRRSRRW